MGEDAGEPSCTSAALTIVDLAGAERESKTGNQVPRNAVCEYLIIDQPKS